MWYFRNITEIDMHGASYALYQIEQNISWENI